jgi:uncharacterized protein (DUF486 family)
MITAILLFISNIFMTLAWYGHLKYKVVFTMIAWLLFRQTPRWNNVVSFVLIIAAVYFTFNFNK